MVKHPNESRFEFALRLTKALKAQEQFIWVYDVDSNREYLDAKQILDVLYDEIMNPVDPTPSIEEDSNETWREDSNELCPCFNSEHTADNIGEEFNEFSPSVMEEAAPKVDYSFVDTLKKMKDLHWGYGDDRLGYGNDELVKDGLKKLAKELDLHWGLGEAE